MPATEGVEAATAATARPVLRDVPVAGVGPNEVLAHHVHPVDTQINIHNSRVRYVIAV